MDNFEYSIQLNDREWAEFFLASEECNLAPASLATAEEQCLSDIDQGDRSEDLRAPTHKDMCLVFCAFASWAVKTSDLQAPDAWKTMFLASFGTLSAIRYFRRQVREGHPRT
ncbi:PREDICTED: PGC-1 and ERR-induced regulator in muscle protein 1-like [Acanthisitta chloris]|uniref:PGC-1 and ERR-induced regulator in muscle protein 1-like n=1 Tax=Acanthisitta chloris TaxID=57068 RepID=UPI0004F0FF03|nr:PREDICTED: PGC-1 and ERR-induced regulator in muscle protein 1-like [Acanthisitta chloris]